MTALIPGKFSNLQTRPVKRRLSRYEKSTVLDTTGRALVLPSDPNTEIEELVDAGFNPCLIYGIERDTEKFLELTRHYHDQAHIYHDDIFTWMRAVRGTGRYSYIHLDLCGHLNREIAIKLQSWRSLPSNLARVRFSNFRGRRSPYQFEEEAQLIESLLLRWCQLGFELDTVDPERWISHHNNISENLEDSTFVVLAIAIANFFFGIDDYRVYVDDCASASDFLPVVDGRFTLANIKRCTYHEPNQPNYMFSTWFDLMELDLDGLRNSTQWILNQLDAILTQLSYTTPSFDATFYQE